MPNTALEPTARWPFSMTGSQHVYEVRPRKDKRHVDLMSDALPFGRLCYGEPAAVGNAIGYVKFYSRSHHAVIRVYDEAGNVIYSVGVIWVAAVIKETPAAFRAHVSPVSVLAP